YYVSIRLPHHIYASVTTLPLLSTLFPYTTLFRSPPRSAGARSAQCLPGAQAVGPGRCRPAAARSRAPDRGKRARRWPRRAPRARSEEHTSELQSRFDLVCRLLLEKKKKKTKSGTG